jgi:ferric iron reductase protein FhuF
MIPVLEPLLRGEWAAYGDTLDCASHLPSSAIPVSRFLSDDALLGDAIRRYAIHLGVTGDDLRAAASAWSRVYLWALLPATAAAASVLQHRFPVRANEIAMSLNSVGEPICFHILHQGRPMPNASPAERYGPLLEENLAPLFEAVGKQTRLTQKVLWGNAARCLEAVLHQALALTGDADHVAEDIAALLRQPTRMDGRSNPLCARRRMSHRVENGVATAISLHRECCLFYRLPGQGYCGACPLALEHRRNS